MIELHIPGRGTLQLEHLVCDVNGTLAEDGNLVMGLSRSLPRLSDRLTLHLLTADSHGRQHEIDRALNINAIRITGEDESAQKSAYVRSLGAKRVVAIGQGANDAGMLKEAALGICILSREGLAVSTLTAADIVVADIHAALELLEKPARIVTTLRR